ncbi:longitudinals lacking protein, isoforms N/O/W/X/Y-like isoform X4 [Drosophila nasuta]|uniref:longitudinals lacking protein, isoforms N/O/W/X/Y-like isoform X4 n=1 Tax=Drosophila nasuta TaxID=42062 RepID=UPI00295E75CA|nr:longitudinals lacking protein, isoforms N/O/W/X/Y-like isoform X4 [Drosophila nasuta]
MDDDQQFCLRWNNHQSTLISVFDTLLENETLVDCTLAAEGKFLKAHKVVLSACSPYFATLLQEQYDKHPIFILKDVKYQELRAMMDYMYRGEVNISQDQLAALLKAAESLQIKGLSDNRSGGNSGASGNTAAAAQAAAQQATKSDAHHRVKLSGTYTLEQTKRSRGAMDVSGDVSGSREGSSSPSRRRRKVRRRSMENDVHDNSNSSVLQSVAAASNQSILQQTSASLAASALVSTQLASGSSVGAAAAATNASGSSSIQVSTQPLTSSSSNVTKKTESAKLTSTAAQGAQQQQQQQQTTTSDAINTDNVQQQQQQQQNESTQGEADEMDVASGGAGVASGAVAVHPGVVKQLATLDKSNHKQKIKDNSITTTATTEMVIEPKAEYDEDAHDENVEDLTLDEEDMTMEELDQAAGTSQGGDGSSQAYATWQHDRSQDELGLMAAQDAQQRDPQDGYWTILETVPYSIANATTSHNQTLSTAQSLSSGNATSLLSGATVVVELPPDDLGNPVGNIQYTIPALTKNATTNTNTTSLLHKPQATTIQIVKQQHTQQQQQHHQQQQQHHQQHQHQRQQISLQQCLDVRQQTRQEYIKIDTSRLEDKMLLRDVMQYGATSISMAPSNANDVVTTTHVVTAHESELLLTDADEAERELELAVIKNDQHEDLLADDDDEEDYVVDKLPCVEEQQQQQQQQQHQQEKLYVNGLSGVHTTMSLQQVNDLAIDDAKYACNVCGKTYKIKGSLKRHKNYECGVEPTLKCPHCPHKCKYKSDLRKHMNQKHSESGDALLLSN